jgi:nucleoside-diphosphate-sugar epimerase
MNILITGAAGFIGSNLLDFLFHKKYKVYGIDNFSTGKLKNIKDSEYHGFLTLDLSVSNNIDELRRYIISNNIEIVYHFAALPNVQQSIEQTSLTHAHTLTSTLNILEAIKNTSVKKIIFASTSAIYGNGKTYPTNEDSDINCLTPYALQKLMSEQYIKLYTELYDISAVCLRNFNVFGERMTNEGAYKSVISIFKEQKSKKLPLSITNDGEQRRDFIHVQDVANANYLCSIMDTGKFNILNIGYGVNFSVNEIADCFGCDKVYIGNRVESKISLCDNTKAKKILNWSPSVNIVDWIKYNI